MEIETPPHWLGNKWDLLGFGFRKLSENHWKYFIQIYSIICVNASFWMQSYGVVSSA